MNLSIIGVHLHHLWIIVFGDPKNTGACLQKPKSCKKRTKKLKSQDLNLKVYCKAKKQERPLSRPGFVEVRNAKQPHFRVDPLLKKINNFLVGEAKSFSRDPDILFGGKLVF